MQRRHLLVERFLAEITDADVAKLAVTLRKRVLRLLAFAWPHFTQCLEPLPQR